MKYAKIKNGKVENIIIADEEFIKVAEGDFVLIQDKQVSIGDTYNSKTGKFSKPPTAAEEVTDEQLDEAENKKLIELRELSKEVLTEVQFLETKLSKENTEESNQSLKELNALETIMIAAEKEAKVRIGALVEKRDLAGVLAYEVRGAKANEFLKKLRKM